MGGRIVRRPIRRGCWSDGGGSCFAWLSRLRSDPLHLRSAQLLVCATTACARVCALSFKSSPEKGGEKRTPPPTPPYLWSSDGEGAPYGGAGQGGSSYGRLLARCTRCTAPPLHHTTANLDRLPWMKPEPVGGGGGVRIERTYLEKVVGARLVARLPMLALSPACAAWAAAHRRDGRRSAGRERRASCRRSGWRGTTSGWCRAS